MRLRMRALTRQPHRPPARGQPTGLLGEGVEKLVKQAGVRTLGSGQG